jgi:hypothetical protein
MIFNTRWNLQALARQASISELTAYTDAVLYVALLVFQRIVCLARPPAVSFWIFDKAHCADQVEITSEAGAFR